MKKRLFIYLSVFTLIFSLSSCDNESLELPELDYVSFQSTALDFGVDIDGQTTQSLNVYASSITNSDRVFDIAVNADGTTAGAAAYTVPSSVTIPAGTNVGTFDVTVADMDIEGKTLELQLSSDQDTFFGQNMIIQLSQKCPDGLTRLDLEITFDDWPEEIYWRIVSNGVVIDQSADPAAFGAYAGLTGSIALKWCLPSADYTFEIFDGFGDGAGPFTLTLDGQEIYANDGTYGSGTSFDFTIP
jgi:hypothetical protein